VSKRHMIAFIDDVTQVFQTFFDCVIQFRVLKIKIMFAVSKHHNKNALVTAALHRN
jgi:hypothetical protein